MFNKGVLNSTSETTLSVQDLDVINGGMINITTADSVVGTNGTNLISQSNHATELAVITSTNAVKGDVAKIDLTLNGQDSKQTQSDYMVGNEVAAVLTYDYANLTNQSGGKNGIYTSYTLASIDIKTELTLTSDATNNSFKSEITGSGKLVLDGTQGGGLTLAETNTYTGITNVSGNVTSGATNGFGKTSQLMINSGATVDLAANVEQTVGSLTNIGTVDLATGSTLTIKDGGIAGTLQGEGSIVIDGGYLTVSKRNDDLTGKTTVNSDATLVLNSGSNLGSGSIVLSGTLMTGTVSVGSELSGYGNVSINGNTSFTGDNSQFKGSYNVANTGSLIVSNSNQLGATSNIAMDNGAYTIQDVDSGSFAQTLTGSGSVNLTDSTVNFTGNNSIYTGVYNLTGSTLTVNQSTEIGAGSIQLDDSKLILNSQVNNVIIGNGLMTINSDFIVGNQQIAGLNGAVTIADGKTSINKDTNLGTTSFVLGANGHLDLTATTKSDYAFNQNLTGAGAFDVNLNNGALSLGSNVGTEFSGTLSLTDTTFDLSNTNNQSAIQKSSLTLNSGGIVTSGNTGMKDLVFKGGTLDNTNGTTLEVASLDLTGKGQINVQADISHNAQDTNLIAQSNNSTNLEIIVSNQNVKGDLSDVIVTFNGKAVDTSVSSTTTEAYGDIAELTYTNEWITSHDGKNGIYANFNLQSVSINDQKTLTLISDATNNNFNSTITGTGALTLNAKVGDLTLAKTNDYKGVTTVESGKVIAGADGAFGLGSMIVNSGATIDLAGKNQTVTDLSVAGTFDVNKGNVIVDTLTGAGTLDVNEGSLTINQGSTIDTILTGSGTLIFEDGASTLSGNNKNLISRVDIKTASIITVDSGAALGTGNIDLAGSLVVNGNSTIVNQLSGTGSIALNSHASFTKDNSGFTGLYNVTDNGFLTVTAVNQIGSSSTIDMTKGAFAITNVKGGEFGQTLTGSGSVKLSDSSVSFTGNHSGYAGDYVLTSSTLTIKDNDDIGSGSMTLDGQSELILSSTYNNMLANMINGSGALVLTTGAHLALTDTNSISTGTKFVMSSGSFLDMSVNNAFTFNNAVKGEGTLSVNTNKNNLTLGSNFGSDFTGTLSLTDTNFDLSNTHNQNSAKNASLILNNGTVITSGNTSINHLVFEGGALNSTDSTTLTVKNLDLQEGGVINVKRSKDIEADPNSSLISQSNNSTQFDIIVADNMNGDLSNIVLTLNGEEVNPTIGNSSITGYIVNGEKVANLTYDYTWFTKINDKEGVYGNYGLASIEILQDKNLILVSNATDKSFDSTITGVGNLILDGTSGDGLTLAKTNTYTGVTTVTGGTINVSKTDGLGKTSELIIASSTSVNLAFNVNQTIGSLSSKGTIDLADSSILTIKNGGVAGTLLGTGSIVLSSGDLVVSNINDALTGHIAIDTSATLTLNHGSSFGKGELNLAGTLVTNDTVSVGNKLSGAGTIIINGDTSFSANNSQFIGSYDIANNGSLTINNSNQLGVTANIVMTNGTFAIQNVENGILGQTLAGSGSVDLTNSKVSFMGDHSGYTGAYALTNSALTIKDNDDIGSGNIALGGNSQLVLSSTYNNTLENTISGTGTLVLQDTAQLQVTDANSNKIDSGIAFDLSENSTLDWSSKNALTLNNKTTGTGALVVNANHNILTLGSDFGSDFVGTLSLVNTIFDLSNTNNQSATQKSSLTLNSGGVVTSGNTSMNDLVFKGGTLENTNGTTLEVASLDLTGKGQINVQADISHNAQDTNLIAQSNNSTNIAIIVSNQNVKGDLSDVTVTFNGDKVDTSVISSTTTEVYGDIAELTYSNGWMTELNGQYGIYGSFGLSSVKINQDKELTLTSDKDNHIFNSTITGDGALILNAIGGDLTLAKTNGYKGVTTIANGTVIAGTNGSFGSGSMIVDRGATVDLAGNHQTITDLAIAGTFDVNKGHVIVDTLAGTGILDVNEGSLSVNQGSAVDTILTGSGKLTFIEGKSTLSGINTGFSAEIIITDKSEITVASEKSLGIGNINLAGGLIIKGDETIVNQLSGKGNITVNGNTSFSANNSQFTGSYDITNNGSLTINNSNQLGATSNIAMINGTFAIQNVDNDILGQTLAGSGSVKLSDSSVSFTGNHSGYTGNYVLTSSTLTIKDNDDIGSGSMTLDGQSQLILSSTYNNTLANIINGNGVLVLEDNAKVKVDSANNISAETAFDLQAGSTLDWSSINALTLNNQIIGNGTLSVNTNKNNLTLGLDFGSEFKGTLSLTDTNFTFNTTNSNQLANAAISVGSESNVMIQANAFVSNLTLAGGQLDFTVADNKANGILTVSNDVNISTNSSININGQIGQSGTSSGSLLDDMGAGGGILIVEGEINGNINDIQLSMNGNGIDKDQDIISDITNNGASTAAAKGHYNYRLESDHLQDGSNENIYVDYDLISIELLADGKDALLMSTTAKSNNNLSVELSGEGGLILNASEQDMVVSHTNSYEGQTIIEAGNIQLTADNALGNTSQFTLNKGSSVNLFKAIKQTVGSLNNSGTIDLADGSTLTIKEGGSAGTLSGKGSIILSGGDLAVANANDGLTGKVIVDNKASVSLNHSASNLGKGELALNQGGALNITADGVSVGNDLSGTGSVNIGGNTTLTGANNSGFSGLFNVDSGKTLTATNTAQLGQGSSLALAGNLDITNDKEGVLSQTISGEGNVSINTSTLTISGNNSDFSGQYDLASSNVGVSSTESLGLADINVDKDSIMNMNYDATGSFNNVLTGEGNVIFTKGNIILGDKVAENYDGTLTLKDKTSLTLNDKTELGNGIVFNLDGQDTILNKTAKNGYAFDLALQGDGQVNIDLTDSKNQLTLVSNDKTDFSGIINVANATLNINNASVSMIDQATLGVNTGSHVMVDKGHHELAGINLAGGQLEFMLDGPNAEGTLKVKDTLELSSGTIKVIGNVSEIDAKPPRSESLLDQMTTDQGILLVEGNIKGDTSNVDLSIDGIKDGEYTKTEILNGKGNVAATGNYDYGLGKGKDGQNLYLDYHLESIDLLTDGSDALLINSTAQGSSDLSVALSGKGGLILNASEQDMVVSHTNNYEGQTIIEAGNIQLTADDALGETSKLTLNQGSSVNLSTDKTQTIGSLDNQGTIDLSKGSTLTIKEGGSAGTLKGEGSIVLSGGDLAVANTNDGLTGRVTVDNKASVFLNNSVSNLGKGELALNQGGSLNITADGVSVGNDLSGSGSVNIGGNTTLTGANNSGFSGLFNVDSGKTLTAINTAQLGQGSSLALAGNLDITDDKEGVLSQTISGEGHVSINTSTLTISGNNSDFSGQYDLASSNVGVSSTESLGLADINIDKDSIMSMNYDATGSFNNVFIGEGNVIFTKGNITLGDKAAENYDGTLTINNDVALTIKDDTQLGDMIFSFEGTNSVLNTKADKDYTFNLAVEGNGRVNVDLTNSDNIFTLVNNPKNNFDGVMHLSNAMFDLNNSSTLALDKATLGIGTGSQVTIGDGNHVLVGLELDGGDVYFNNIHDDDGDGNLESAGTITTDVINITDKGGIVHVNLPDELHPDEMGPGYGILDYDEGRIVMALANTIENGVTGAIGAVKLVDKDGHSIDGDYIHEEMIGEGILGVFDYKVVAGDKKDGLYLSYGMTEARIAEGHTMLIGKSAGINRDLSAKITGEGGIAVATWDDVVITFSNGSNDYSGTTTIVSGGLQSEASGALGNTSLLNIQGDAFFNLNGKTQTIGSLEMSQGSSLYLNKGGLTITNDGTSDGTLVGEGAIVLGDASTLTLSGNSANLNANIKLGEGSHLELMQASAAGSSTIIMNDSAASVDYLGAVGQVNNSWSGKGNVVFGSNGSNHSDIILTQANHSFIGSLVINENNKLTVTDSNQMGDASVNNTGTFVFQVNKDQALTNDITGTGTFVKSGTKELIINNDFGYKGNIVVENGSLALTDNGILGAHGNVGIIVKENGNLNGLGTINGNTENFGTIQVGRLDNPTTRATDGSSLLTIEGDLVNHNKINIMASKGYLIGNELVINGNYTGADDSSIYMNATLGNNANSNLDQLTITGHADGSSKVFVKNLRDVGENTDEQGLLLISTGSSKDDAFVLGNTIMAGAYEYRLEHNANDQNWYLSSYSEPAFRPDLGNNISNITLSTQAIIPGFNDHTGLRSLSSFHSGRVDGDNFSSSVWNTTGGSKSKGKTGGGQVHYSNDYFSSTIGGDQVFIVGDSAVQLGVMIGTMEGKSRSHSLVTGSSGKSKVTGETYGIYGSWYINVNDPLSAYVDGSIMYGKYNNKLQTEGNANISYRSHAWSYTLQGGYPVTIGESVALEPQAQITYLDYTAKSYKDNGGTNVSQSLKGNVIGRIGAFVYSTDGDIRPYAGMNLWYDNTQASVLTNNYQTKSNKAGLMMEVKGGVNAQLDKNFSMSVDANYRQGKNKNRDYGVGLTIKYIF